MHTTITNNLHGASKNGGSGGEDERLQHAAGDCIVTFGWIMAEELLKY